MPPPPPTGRRALPPPPGSAPGRARVRPPGILPAPARWEERPERGGVRLFDHRGGKDPRARPEKKVAGGEHHQGGGKPGTGEHVAPPDGNAPPVAPWLVRRRRPGR